MKLKNLKAYIIFATLTAAVLFFFFTALQSGTKHTRTSFALNTYTSITAYGTNADTATNNAVSAVNEVEQKMSAYIPSAELAVLNSSAKKGVPYKVSDELFCVIQKAYEFSVLTDGLFDITVKPITDLWSIASNPRVPSDDELSYALESVGYESLILNEDEKTVTFLKEGMQLDLGAIAKGYAADRAVETLISDSCQKALIDLGGNICVIGENLTATDTLLNTYFGQSIKKPWRIGIQTPFSSSGAHCVTLLIDSSDAPVSIVTSGAYERNFTENGRLYHHIIDPRTGYPFDGAIDSVTIVGKSSTAADALSTSAYMMDIPSALALVKGYGYDALIIDKGKKIHTTMDVGSVIINDDAYAFAE